MNENTFSYMNNNGWKRIQDGGTAGIYSNGIFFVMCNGSEWFTSKTKDASERFPRGYKNMLSAMKYADNKKQAENKKINAIREKVNAAPDKVYNTKVYQYWINGSGQFCRARLADLDTMEMYKENAIEILD